MKRSLSLAAAVAVVLAGVASTASAQFAKPEDAIKYRQSAMTLLGTHVGRLGGMAQGRIPFDAAAAQNSARIAEFASGLPWEAFVPASNIAPSKVKGEPWASAAEFKDLQDKMRAEVAKLPAAAGSADSLRAAMGSVGAACKACHDKFRQ